MFIALPQERYVAAATRWAAATIQAISRLITIRLGLGFGVESIIFQFGLGDAVAAGAPFLPR